MTTDAPKENDLLLDVKNISVDYFASNGTVHAVDNVSFTLRRGEIMGLAGESGCGKSTLAYAVARLLRPPAMITNGKAIYYSRSGDQKRNSRNASSVDILELHASELREFRWDEMAVVFQSAMNALNPVMKIGAQIMDVLQVHRPEMKKEERRARAVALLGRVGIAADRLNSYPHELSGGMRQRAVIAIALALDPELIIMDEPTTALDVVVQREILELISALCRDMGMSLIFITHDLSLLLELVDKIAIMYAGKLIETASRDDMYQHARHPYSYGLLNSFPTLHGPRRKMVGIPGSPPDLRLLPAGCPFQARCPLAFDECATVRPPLQPSTPESPEQLVACHLYNSTYRGEPPTTEEMAEKYEALSERNVAR